MVTLGSVPTAASVGWLQPGQDGVFNTADDIAGTPRSRPARSCTSWDTASDCITEALMTSSTNRMISSVTDSPQTPSECRASGATALQQRFTTVGDWNIRQRLFLDLNEFRPGTKRLELVVTKAIRFSCCPPEQFVSIENGQTIGTMTATRPIHDVGAVLPADRKGTMNGRLQHNPPTARRSRATRIGHTCRLLPRSGRLC